MYYEIWIKRCSLFCKYNFSKIVKNSPVLFSPGVLSYWQCDGRWILGSAEDTKKSPEHGLSSEETRRHLPNEHRLQQGHQPERIQKYSSKENVFFFFFEYLIVNRYMKLYNVLALNIKNYTLGTIHKRCPHKFAHFRVCVCVY